MRQRAGLGRERDRRASGIAAGGGFVGGDFRVRIPVILELVDRHLMGRDHQLSIARLPGLQRHARLHVLKMARRDDIKAFEVDRVDRDRRTFID